MRSQNIIQELLFATFFSLGTAAMVGAILCDELLAHYRNHQLLKEQQEFSIKLESLNADYDALLEQVNRDPNLIKRIGPITLGTEPNDPNTAYPRATVRQLTAARKALMKEDSSLPKPSEPAVPAWLTRCSEPRRRVVLFLAGAALILVALTCFRSVEVKKRE